MKTYTANLEDIAKSHQFHLIDAEDVTLGRLATVVATLLRGKHKPIFTPFLDTGDHVIIVNAEKVKLTGKKLDDKKMIHHTGFPGGLKQKPYREVLETRPERAIEKAVWGMLPKSRLGRKMIKKLRIYKGPEHQQQSQKPVPYSITK